MLRNDTHDLLTKDEFRQAMARIDTRFAEQQVEFRREISWSSD